jgi:hypothetical protein
MDLGLSGASEQVPRRLGDVEVGIGATIEALRHLIGAPPWRILALGSLSRNLTLAE